VRAICVSQEEPRLSSGALAGRPDEELVALARDGDSAAFGELVRRHTAAVHRWMARAVGEQEADDLTQEVFLKAYRAMGRFRGDAPVRAWLASIADNAVKNRYRALGRFRRIFQPSDPDAVEPTSSGASPEQLTRSGESRRAVAEALRRLPPDFRMAVVLRDLEEWSYEEIAASLGLPVGTVKSRIARGRGQLREILLPFVRGGKAVS
jgi:RNA polymerase sigma-70 factor, ECF subfamily